MPSKKPVRSNTWMKRAKASWSKAFRSISGTRGPALIALVAICVLTAAVVIALRDASEQAQVAAADEQVAAAAAKPAQAKAATPKARPAAKVTVADTKSTSSSDKPSPKPSALSAAVTVSGCLERTDDGFRLKDTSGDEAPKSRSWKSGFLKKGSASVDIVDAAHGLKLADHVGQRVSVTGTLIDREMRAHSLQRVAGSCK